MSSTQGDLVRHGTYSGYARWHCRCQDCVAYQRERVARNRRERRETGRLSHGRRSAWDAGCRCDECLRAHREAEREYLSDPVARSRDNARKLARYHRRAWVARSMNG